MTATSGTTRADDTTANAELLVVDDLRTKFHVPAGAVKAVDGVSFTLKRGKTLGVVGESGSGKTVLSRSIMGLNIASNAESTGSVRYEGQELIGRTPKQMRQFWGAEMSMVFQDPMTSLNPVVKVGRQLTEHVRHHFGMGKAEARTAAIELLRSVRIPEPSSGSTTIRTRCRAACASACASRSRSPAAPSCCSPTSRPPRSTSPCSTRSSTCSPSSRATAT